MIISASRRTDVPMYYADWLFNRIRAGYAYVRNPVNPRQVSRVSLEPEAVDGIVFWTKNPAPMLDRLDALKEYMYYFQFTLTSYGQDVERHIPHKGKAVIPAFQRLSDSIGPQRVIWRYDPIFLSPGYPLEYHIRWFEILARKLAPYTRKCIVSFLDFYRDTARNMAPLAIRPWEGEQRQTLARALAQIARSYNLTLESCAEDIPLEEYGIRRARCVDGDLLGQLLGRPLAVGKDKNQRLACGCAQSVDIGAYHSCPGGCLYCYANRSPGLALANRARHDPAGPLLLGQLGPEDKVTQREITSRSREQTKLDL